MTYLPPHEMKWTNNQFGQGQSALLGNGVIRIGWAYSSPTYKASVGNLSVKGAETVTEIKKRVLRVAKSSLEKALADTQILIDQMEAEEAQNDSMA